MSPFKRFFHPEFEEHHCVYNYNTITYTFFLSRFGRRNLYLKSNISRFVKFKIDFSNHLNCEAEDGKLIKYFSLTGYYKEDLAVQTIERYWDRYQWNYRKNLAEKLYHPSKIDFII